ncbi:MAG: acyl-CoA dehydrogenase family protein [Acidimicrobiales bacterium]
MDLNLSEEQQQLVDTFSSLYAKESTGERVRAAEPSGFDAVLWERLLETGVVEMAVDEGSGGWGATLLDLALVAEQHGRHLGSAPLIESQTAARLLARAATGGAREMLERALPGAELVTVALHPPRRGMLHLVPAGAVADRVVFFDGDRLLVADCASAATQVANLGALPVADVAVGETTEILAGPAAARAHAAAVDDWLALMAGALVGLARRALEIGVDYAKERHAFGVPIGSFQAVAHGLADAATAVDGAELLSREASWAAGAEPGRFAELAALAFGFSADAARDASYYSLHYHGGYGFMMEYDIQLYYRRAKAWPAQYGAPDTAFARAEACRLGMGVR